MRKSHIDNNIYLKFETRLRRSLVNEEIQDIIEQLHVNDRTVHLGNSEPEKPVKATKN